MEAVSQIKDSEGNSKGIGVFYWAPEWIPVLDDKGNNLAGWITGQGNDSENRALFDFNGKVLPSINVFKDVRKSVSELPEGKLYSAKIIKLRPASATVTVSETSELPATVKAEYSDGTIRDVCVKWDNIKSSDLLKLHTITVYGSVEGTTEKAVLNLNVIGKKNYVKDYSFESGNLSNWTVTRDSDSVQAYIESSPGNNAYTGDRVFHYYISPNSSGFTVQQTITGLPNGTYTLKVVSHGGDYGTVERYLFAKDYGGEEKKVSFANTGWRDWKQPEIKNINVTNGQCTIGVRIVTAGSGTWGKLDDFELYPDLSSANLALPYSISAGSNFTVKLSYSNLIYNVYAQDIAINYDKDKLEFVDAVGASSDIKVLSKDTEIPGMVRIIAANTGTGGLSWNADVLSLFFKAKSGSIGTDDITISRVLMGTAPEGSVVEPAGLTTTRTAKPSSSSNGSSRADSPSVPVETTPSTSSELVKVAVKTPVVENGMVKISVDEIALKNAFETVQEDAKGMKTVLVSVDKIEGRSAYEVILPAASLATKDLKYMIKIDTGIGMIIVPANMLSISETQGVQKVSIVMTKADKAGLGNTLEAQILDRPIIEIKVKLDEKEISWDNPDAPVTVSIPYTPAAEELKVQEHIVVWHIDDSGNIAVVPNSKYDATRGGVVFSTTHFSKFAVAFVHKTFDDMDQFEWAKKPIQVLASKGIVKGTSETTFTPEKNITRAEYIVMLVRAFGLTAKVDGNFNDVKSTDYYYQAVGIAKKLGIVTGTDNNNFNPGESITRQDLMVLTARALKAAKRLSSEGFAEDLEKFKDVSEISDYALESVSVLVNKGIVNGRNGLIHPKDDASRAEAAVIIYRASKN